MQVLKSKRCSNCNSGTSALYAALIAADIKKGDEILVPSFTFVASTNFILAMGAKPIFVDINLNDYTLDLKSKITNKSKAIIPVHFYGDPSAIDEINELVNTHSSTLIEDVLSLMGRFTLYASKVLTCGEGGAIATNFDYLAEKLEMIRNHAMFDGYDTSVFSLNLMLPELSAAIAKVQTKKLQRMLESRRRNT